MSSFTYLVRKHNKTLLELGKSINWKSDFEIFKIKKLDNLILNDPFSEEIDIYQYYISDNDLSYLMLYEHFNRSEYDESCKNDEYIKLVVNKILKFIDNNNIYIITDCFDSLSELRHVYDYKITCNRYSKI